MATKKTVVVPGTKKAKYNPDGSYSAAYNNYLRTANNKRNPSNSRAPSGKPSTSRLVKRGGKTIRIHTVKKSQAPQKGGLKLGSIKGKTPVIGSASGMGSRTLVRTRKVGNKTIKTYRVNKSASGSGSNPPGMIKSRTPNTSGRRLVSVKKVGNKTIKRYKITK